ncbi:MAG: aldo/keto reductase [Solirubrobacterales bacterium]
MHPRLACEAMAVDALTDATAGTIRLGDLEVRRLGFGAMRITGEGVWGARRPRRSARGPAARDRARGQPHRHRRLLRPRGQRGADRRGPPSLRRGAGDSDQGRLRPSRPRPVGGGWPARAPARGLRALLRRLRLERIDLYQLHVPDCDVPYGGVGRGAEGAPGRGQDPPDRRLQRQRRAAGDRSRDRRRRLGPEPLQPRRSQRRRRARRLPARRHRLHPLVPLDAGSLAKPGGVAAEVAQRHGASPAQVALAWLLQTPSTLPIPGTSSVAHLEENVAAVALRLGNEEMAELSGAA